MSSPEIKAATRPYSRQVRSKKILPSAGTEALHSEVVHTCRCTWPLSHLSGGEVEKYSSMSSICQIGEDEVLQIWHHHHHNPSSILRTFVGVILPLGQIDWIDRQAKGEAGWSKSRLCAPRMAFSLLRTGGRLLFRPKFAFVCFLTLLQSRPTEEVFLTSSDHHQHRTHNDFHHDDDNDDVEVEHLHDPPLLMYIPHIWPGGGQCGNSTQVIVRISHKNSG